MAFLVGWWLVSFMMFLVRRLLLAFTAFLGRPLMFALRLLVRWRLFSARALMIGLRCHPSKGFLNRLLRDAWQPTDPGRLAGNLQQIGQFAQGWIDFIPDLGPHQAVAFLPGLVIPRWCDDPEQERDCRMGTEIWNKVNPSLRKLTNLLEIASQTARVSGLPRISKETIEEAFGWMATQTDHQRSRRKKTPPDKKTQGKHERASEERREGKQKSSDKEHHEGNEPPSDEEGHEGKQPPSN